MVVVESDVKFTYSTNRNCRYGYYIDNTLLKNFEGFLFPAIKKKHDMIILITGLEGTGKSTFAQTLARYIDKNFNINSVVFTGQDLMKCIDNAKPGQTLIFDEAIMDMASQDFATEMQKVLIKKFTLIRKKRLVIFILIPSIFMLRKYFAIFRTRIMLNCYCPDGISRGYFKFYSFTKKKKLYLKGYKEMDMGCVKPDFKGRFTDTYGLFLDHREYEKKKDLAIKALTEEKTTDKEKLREAFNDFKLKVKLDVSNYKTKMKEKFDVLKFKMKENVNKYKELTKKHLDNINKQSVELQKSKDKKRISELDKENRKLLFAFYSREKAYFERSNYGKTFSWNTFCSVLEEAGNIKYNNLKIKKVVTSGEELYKIEKI